MPRHRKGFSQTEEDLSRLIGEIYNCALDPDCWETTLEHVTDFVHGTNGMFLLRDKSAFFPVIGTTARVDPEALQIYRLHYHEFDLWMQRARTLPAGTTGRGIDLAPFGELRKTEFHNDFIRPNEASRMMFATTASTDKVFGHVSICREEALDEFEDDDLQRLGLLLPHLQRASEIVLKLSGTAARAWGLEAVLNSLADGVILLDDRGEIVGLNRVAQKILESSDGFSFAGGEFRGANTQHTVALRKLVAGVVSGQNSPTWDAGGSLRLARHSGRPGYIVMICPMPPVELAWCLSRPVAAIFITDPEWLPKLASDALQQIFQLTPAEARFAEAFVQETNLQATAHRLSITEGSARIYLKRVFEKVGVNSQASLVKLLLSSLCVARPIPDGHAEGELDH